jgi:hypothetical protein
MKTILTATFVFGLCGLAHAGAEPAGVWKCEYTIGETKRTSTLTISKDGDGFTGTMTWPDQKDVKLKDVKLKDGVLTFSAVREFMGNKIPIDYKLTFTDDTFKGKGTSDYGERKQDFEIEGKREK